MVLKAFRFRLLPTAEQVVFLNKCMGCSRFIYNQMLADKKAYYEEHGEPLFSNTPATYKATFPFLKEVDSLALANAQLHLNTAYRNFSEGRAEFPTFKKKGKRDSYTTNNQKGTIQVVGSKVKLPKVGWIKLKLHRQISGKIKSATIIRTPSGKYDISILCDTEVQPFKKTGSAVGIDLGIADLAILSDGSKIDNPKWLQRMEGKLAKEQRTLSRRFEANVKERIYYQSGPKKGRVKKIIYHRPLAECSNYQKQRLKVAKLHAKIANQRKNTLHKLTTNLVKNHDLLVIEDLAPSNLMKNRKLSRAIANVSWSTFKTFLTYKAEWYGKQVVTISRWYPSSQLCSNCNTSSGKKPLHVRDWTCETCGAHHDRDVNAAKNILHEGLRLA